MTPLPYTVSDNDLIAFIDSWAALLEAENYQAAFELTEDASTTRWTPDLIREHIKGYNEALPSQKVTVVGKPTDITQRKKVSRWKQPNPRNELGEIWYDLNIDGFASDLTATFRFQSIPQGIVVRLNDINVM